MLHDPFSFVTIAGEDRFAFLQRLVSADISPATEKRAVWSDLLNPNGRILFTFLIIPIGEGLWLSTPREHAEKLHFALKDFAVHEQVSLAINDRMTTKFTHPPKHFEDDRGLVKRTERTVFFVDPRSSKLGTRIIFPQGETPPLDLYNQDNAMSFEQYRFLTYRLGIVEDTVFSKERPFLPLEVGHHLFDAISFDKGCFVGQEVNARMHHKTTTKRFIFGGFCTHPILQNTDFPYTVPSDTITNLRVMTCITNAEKQWSGLILCGGNQSPSSVTIEGHTVSLSSKLNVT